MNYSNLIKARNQLIGSQKESKDNQEIPATFEEACQIINKLKGGK